MNQIFDYYKYYKPGLGGSWLLVAIILVGSVVVGVLLPGAPQSVTYGLMMVLPFLFCWWMGQNAYVAGGAPTRIDAPHFGQLPAAGFLLLAAVAMVALSVVSDPATSFIPMPDTIKALFEKVFMESPLWDMIVSTCILAPLCEEFLCRGMMLRGMLHSMSPRKAIIWSAVLFAVMHMNPWQSIPAFLIGLFLGWVYWRTHSLWATIFLHFFNNAFATVMSRLWPDMPIDTGLYDLLPATTYWIVIAAAAVVLAIILNILYEKTLPAKVQGHTEA